MTVSSPVRVCLPQGQSTIQLRFSLTSLRFPPKVSDSMPPAFLSSRVCFLFTGFSRTGRCLEVPQKWRLTCTGDSHTPQLTQPHHHHHPRFVTEKQWQIYRNQAAERNIFLDFRVYPFPQLWERWMRTRSRRRMMRCEVARSMTSKQSAELAENLIWHHTLFSLLCNSLNHSIRYGEHGSTLDFGLWIPCSTII